MVNLSSLIRIKNQREKKRIGRGRGSGKGGHSVGRGTKGQKARGKVGLLFAGTKGKKSWLKRLPLWRGRGRFKSQGEKLAINLDFLNKHCSDGEKVTKEWLIEKKMGKQKKGLTVKVLSGGKIEKKLIISLPCSRKAKEKIIAAGGEVISNEKRNLERN